MLEKFCPCGNPLSYQDCCGKYIEKNELPPTPEALMRSRYTAYVLKNVKYIISTMRGKALKKFNKHSTQDWSDDVKWEKLTVLSTEMKAPRLGIVTFEAHYNVKGVAGCIYEKSEFQKIGPQWFYVNGKKPRQ